VDGWPRLSIARQKSSMRAPWGLRTSFSLTRSAARTARRPRRVPSVRGTAGCSPNPSVAGANTRQDPDGTTSMPVRLMAFCDRRESSCRAASDSTTESRHVRATNDWLTPSASAIERLDHFGDGIHRGAVSTARRDSARAAGFGRGVARLVTPQCATEQHSDSMTRRVR